MRVAILGLLALMVGGATIFFAKEWLATERASTAQGQPAPIPTTQVLVATVDMSPGHFVKPDDLRWQPWPKDSVVPTYILESDEAMDDLSGTVVRTMIGSGEPVTENRLVRPGDRGFLAAVLLPGMRAVSVPVNETSGIAGLIYPGDHVDVILTHAVQQASAVGIQTRQVSETVLTNVRVLAIDQNVSLQGPTGAVADTATLEVSPQQAEKVSVMMQIGRLSLSLRSLAEASSPASPDNTHTVTMDTDVSSLIERPAPEAEAGPPPPEPAPQVTIVRGGQSTIMQQAAPPSATPPAVTPPGDAEIGEAPSPEANLRLN
ncbi:MAG: Flp pilus assembly protein CpaB [Alphaproteobacteria bacterium]